MFPGLAKPRGTTQLCLVCLCMSSVVGITSVVGVTTTLSPVYRHIAQLGLISNTAPLGTQPIPVALTCWGYNEMGKCGRADYAGLKSSWVRWHGGQPISYISTHKVICNSQLHLVMHSMTAPFFQPGYNVLFIVHEHSQFSYSVLTTQSGPSFKKPLAYLYPTANNKGQQ